MHCCSVPWFQLLCWCVKNEDLQDRRAICAVSDSGIFMHVLVMTGTEMKIMQKSQKRFEWKFYGGGCTAYDSADSVAYRPYLSWILSA